ncbi:MAG: adenine phosphoribosyltransferase [Bacteroidales bacterium]|nr:adenine phosphoribosyltransferase [Bacteroidales bacterium]
MGINRIKEKIRVVEDFPKKGILFRDLTTVFKDSKCLYDLSTLMTDLYKDKGITKVVGIESRGFIMGPVVATNLKAGFVTLRKPGKLPAETFKESYEKEYGLDTIEIHKDALNENDVVLIHDDLLATGGTMLAAFELVKKFKVKKIYINFIVELEDLNGRSLFPENIEIESLIKY